MSNTINTSWSPPPRQLTHWQVILKNGIEFNVDAVTIEVNANGDALFRNPEGVICAAVADWLSITEKIDA